MIGKSLCLVVLSLATLCIAYPPPNMRIQGSEGHDYVFFRTSLNFTDAIKLCRSVGMNIMTLNENRESAALSVELMYAKRDRVWLGVVALDNNFAIDVEGNLVEEKFWGLHEPDSSDNARCATFTNDRVVELIQCDEKFPVACEINTKCNK